MNSTCNIFWFRRDLRLHDNAALFHALRSGKPVLPVFIFDTAILDQLDNKTDARVAFIHATLQQLQLALAQVGSGLVVYHDTPMRAFGDLLKKYTIESVYANADYEPYARRRDEAVTELLRVHGIPFRTYKDHVIFAPEEVLKDDGRPYTVFTPYSKKWKAKLLADSLNTYPSAQELQHFMKRSAEEIPSLPAIGFASAGYSFPPAAIDHELLRQYAANRDYPAREGTSRLGVHLRFGTISIRDLVREAGPLSEVFVNELIWREFYQMILWHFPHVASGRSFKPAYDFIQWRNNAGEFDRWCQGTTGYPMVDAGMRQLNETGFMHNRLRMITASFLAKHLLIDWRWGEAYFAEKLLDYELGSNNGGWQWAAGCGCDAVPYFRIFNPVLQAKKFDPGGDYIRKWVTDLSGFSYPEPIVEHETARQRCLQTYRKAVKEDLI